MKLDRTPENAIFEIKYTTPIHILWRYENNFPKLKHNLLLLKQKLPSQKLF